MRRALVLGGTGHVGRAVVRGLVAAGVAVDFTWCLSTQRARELEQELGCRAHRLDVRDVEALRGLCRTLAAEERVPDVLVHCIGMGQSRTLADIEDDDWEALHAINVRSAFVVTQQLAGPMAARGGGDIVLTAGFDTSKPLPAPIHFAATQGALCGMVRALSKELGPRGIRVNLVTLGVLEEGLSSQLAPQLREDYRRFSAYGRLGSASEAARAIIWTALHNPYMTGAVLNVNGGL